MDKLKSENKHLKRLEENQNFSGNEEDLIDSIYKFQKKRIYLDNDFAMKDKNISNNISSESSIHKLNEIIIENDDIKEFNHKSSEENSHFNVSFKEKLNRLFSPFSLYLDSICVLNDCIYYPPRLLLSLIIGIITSCYITYTFLIFSLTLDQSY